MMTRGLDSSGSARVKNRAFLKKVMNHWVQHDEGIFSPTGEILIS